jgi:threonine aldolase
MFGGAMRQAGILAAAALYALENNIGRLAEDHANARRLAEALAEIPGVHVDPAHVETNIILVDLEPQHGTAADVAARLKERGVWLFAIADQRLRIVTHMDVSRAQIDEAIGVFRQVLEPALVR